MVAEVLFAIAVVVSCVFTLVLIATLLIVMNRLSDQNGRGIYILTFDVDPHNYIRNNLRFICLVVRSAFYEPKPTLVELYKTKTTSLLIICSVTSFNSVGDKISE